jgi:hypothetical protein
MNEQEYIRALDYHLNALERARLELDNFRKQLDKPPYSDQKNNLRGNLNVISRGYGEMAERYRLSRQQLWDDMNEVSVADIIESELEEAIAKQGSPI